MFSTLGWVILFSLVGAAAGSFLNVCIYRIPNELSIVFPPSRCPHCGHPVRICDNIPVLSYLILGGKCRDCRKAISSRYPLVEILTAALAGLLFLKYGLTVAFPSAFAFVCVLIVIAFIDFDHRIIHDQLTLTGIPVFAVLAVLFMGLPIADAFLGIMIGAGSLYFVAVYYEAITGREGMGIGDIHLLAMLGAFLGWKALLFILLGSSLLGSVVGLTVMIWKGKDMRYALPFGPFLCAAAVLVLFAGDRLTGLIFAANP